MATLRKRPGPRGQTRWQAQIVRRGWTPQYATFPTQRQAARWARQVETEMADGHFVPEGAARTTTLRAALTRYAAEITPTKRSALREWQCIRRWMRRPLANCTLVSLRTADIARFIQERVAEGVAGNTIRLELALLSHLFTVAQRDWGMESLQNPVLRARRPRLAPGRNRRLRPGEAAALRAAAQTYGGPIGPILGIALETGLRRAEIAGIQWGDIDWERAVLTVPRHKTEHHTGRPRYVPLSRTARALLAQLFPDANAPPCALRPDSITQAFATVCRRAGVAGLTFHDLRHEATSRLFEKGLTVPEVAAVTGHRNQQMLQRYTHLQPERIARRLDALEVSARESDGGA
ncbi:MAG: tyrosine-type recombinase/integrase [Acidiferrobacterales bacterium]